MPGMVPSYPQPYNLFQPLTGVFLYSGPTGEKGYGSPGINTASWVMPDGRRAWYYPNVDVSQANRVSLGLQKTLDESPRLNYDQLYALYRKHGANDAQADIMAAINLAESAGATAIHNHTESTGDDSIGLGQVNLLAHPKYRTWNLYDPDTNCLACKEISGDFTNYHPWTTYTSGAYAKFKRGSNSPKSSTGGGGSAPPVAEPGAPVIPPQQTPPSGAFGSSAEGPVRQTVDRWIGHIPSLFGLGSALRDGIQAVLDPVADVVDEWVQILAKDIEGAIDYAGQVAGNALTYAEDLIEHSIALAEQGLQNLAKYTGGLIRAAEDEALRLVRDAESLADRAVSALAHLTATLIRDAINEAERLVKDAESLADKGLTSLAHLTGSLIKAAEEEALRLVHDAEGLADKAVNALSHLTATLIKDAEQEARKLVHEAEDLADGALRTLVDDVIDPLKREVEHIVDDILGPVETVLKDLLKAAKWVAWLATQPFEIVEDIVDTVHNMTPEEVVAIVMRRIDSGESVHSSGIWGVAR